MEGIHSGQGCLAWQTNYAKYDLFKKLVDTVIARDNEPEKVEQKSREQYEKNG